MTLSYIFNANDLGVKDDHLDLKTKVQPYKVYNLRVQLPRVQSAICSHFGCKLEGCKPEICKPEEFKPLGCSANL